MQSMALAPNLIDKTGYKTLANLLSVVMGALVISALAQVALPLPWTPVPITGQTLGISLVSLLWGWKRGFSSVGLYLLLGFSGAPVFAAGASGLVMGPTFGYLIGMAGASVLMGHLADWGMAKGFWTALLSCYVGSLVTFGFGIIGLSFFVPAETLLWSGVIPFLPGDLIKNITAASIVSRFR